MEKKIATPEESKQLLDDLIKNGIKANGEAIAEIVGVGEIAIVVYKLAPATDEHGRATHEALRAIGWDGSASVFKVSAATRKRMIAQSEAYNDPITARWLRGGRNGRIFVWTGLGTFLLNHSESGDLTVEPGSLDMQRPQA